MFSRDQVEEQLQLLATYRKTLAQYLRQIAAVGSAQAQPSLISGIDEARDHIKRIKEILRRQCTPVEDHPNDDDPSKPLRTRIFISYKRDIDPDQTVALQIFQALRQHHEVFIDQMMPIGTKWAERIKSEICQSHFLITLLSPTAINSEMVGLEIATAYQLSTLQGGRPSILPIRLNFREPFQYPLNEYLNQLHWSLWTSPKDTPDLISEILRAIAGGKLGLPPGSSVSYAPEAVGLPYQAPPPVAQPSLDLPEGTMRSDSFLYVNRSSDDLATAAISRQGVTITIKGPRQMGKSSLLIRTMTAAQRAGKRVVMLDFQLFDPVALNDADRFYRDFCTWLSDELGLDNRVDEYWAIPLGNSQRCTRYVGRYLLPAVKEPLVLALDEVETIFDTPFRSPFFGMLRSWHNKRNTPTEPIWNQLDLALVTSTEPYQLIANLNQSPFNVGHVIELIDFTPDQIADLNRRQGMPLTKDDERRLESLIGGHPYLVRRALYLVASGQNTSHSLFLNATEDRGPFGDHLRYHLFRLHDKPDLISGMLEAIQNNTCRDERIFFRLQGAGLVRREQGKVIPRCRLYADYFRERLNG